MIKKDLLGQIDFGHRIAEEEGLALANYFVETDNWRRLYNGDIDVIYGPKGAGKSALYSLLVSRTNDLFDRQILVAPAENPRGTPAFADLVADPPATEREFVALWKLYFASLLSSVFDEFGINNEYSIELNDLLEREGLAKGKRNLQALVRASFDYVKSFFRRPSAVEGGIKLDPMTQLPSAFTGKISFGEPSAEKRKEGHRPVDELLELANRALTAAGYDTWILLDRLDVAFVDSPELEQNALRALFRVYLDLSGLDRIKLKIFLRSDIWYRITRSGFREASHITKTVTINWDRASLVNLIVRRLLHNKILLTTYDVEPATTLDTAGHQELFVYRLFPPQVDAGERKPTTIDWMLTRTADGTQRTAPRELIHLLNTLRARQVQRLETGQPEPPGDLLFERQTFKEALPEVSDSRLTQTIYAEYPSLREPLEKLRGEKTRHSIASLSNIWKIATDDAQKLAENLVEIGFFERQEARGVPEYWVPFLYRDALELVQGTADD
jgi:hypothetical protein